MSNNVRRFVNWDAKDAMGLTQQMAARVEKSRAAGEPCGLCCVFIWEDAEGVRHYEPAYSLQEPEVTLMAAKILEHQVLRGQNIV